jgi:glycosyltransferase involved in cell wall biosynthesis
MQKALMITHAGAERPFHSASEALNAYVREALEKLNYKLEAMKLPLSETGTGESLLAMWPLQAAERLKRLEEVDVAFFCETYQWMEMFEFFKASKKVVFFHSLVSMPLVWMRRDCDLCGNSQWTQDVLRSLGGYPDWASRNMLCPDVFQRSAFVKCPLPALENLNGLGVGNPLPDSIWKELEQDDCIYGLDSLAEANDQIHASLIVAINMIARQHADGRRFRLIVHEHKLSQFQELMSRLPSEHPLIMALNTLQMTWRDLCVPIPYRLQQSDFFRLMRRSRFFLAINRIPETFGMMPLECVMQGCPVYTNGSGNLRFLLPHSGNGMRVEDTEGLLDGDFDEHLRVAALIYGNAIQLDRDGTSPIREDLARGQGFIRENYSPEVFFESFSAMLGRSRPALPLLHEMQLDLSPTVRQWNRSSGRMLTDYGNHFLEHPQTKELERLLGRSAADLFGHATSHEQVFISGLWKKNVLTWRPQLT